MKGNLFVLKGVSDFAPGAFENTAVEAGSIQLGQRGTEYLAKGSYTSPAMRPKPFTRLLPGWNVDTPHGATVELQARVASGGQWSRWLSFGVWSPFIYRHSMENEGDEIARIEGDVLVMANEGQKADTAQLRILLYTEDVCQTPRVHLLAATLHNEDNEADEPARCGRVLEIPSYSCLVRDPSISGRIASATALCMLMNRWGQDTLPEEVARAMYDTELGRFGNMSFVSAAAGMYGYECYPRFCGLDAIRREVQHGYAMAARVNYRAPALGEETAEEEAPEAENTGAQDGSEPPRHSGEPAGEPANPLPLLNEAVMDSSGHLVVVRGFVWEGEREYVVFNDPYSESDAAVRKQVPVEVFSRIYTGLAFFLHKGPAGAGTSAPERQLTRLEIEGCEIHLTARGELLQPGETIPGKASSATVCYTLSDGIAYASAAQKKFYYLSLGDGGAISFDEQTARGHKLTFYLVGSKGTTWVAEKMVNNPEKE